MIALVDLGEESAGSRERLRAAVVAGVLALCSALVAPVITLPLGSAYSVFAIVIALAIAAVSVTAVLLWAQARVSRSVPLSVLAAGYGLTAVVMLPYMLFYRGLWPQLGALVSADPQTSPWLYCEWHAIFVFSAIAYFIVRRQYRGKPRPSESAFATVRRNLTLFCLALFATTVPASIWVDGLPKLANNGHSTPLFVVLGIVIAGGALAAIVIAYATRQFTALLGVWLSVSTFSMFVDVTLTEFSHQFAAGWYLSRLCILVASTAVLLVLLFQTASIYEQLAVTAERLRDESLTDVLTGLANRRRFDQVFLQVMRELARSKRPIALLMIDIDNFKNFNDTFGHQGGDECLRRVAEILQNRVGRARDLVARTGGEEIAVIMPEIDMQGALVVAERLRAAVMAAAIPQGLDAAYDVVTVSIGVAATYDPGSTTVEALVAAADRALYRAKDAGRNCVVEDRDFGAGTLAEESAV